MDVILPRYSITSARLTKKLSYWKDFTTDKIFDAIILYSHSIRTLLWREVNSLTPYVIHNGFEGEVGILPMSLAETFLVWLVS